MKQKPITDTDILLFAQTVADWGLVAGLYVALDRRSIDLDARALESQALRTAGVGMRIITSVPELILEVATWGLLNGDEILRRFPNLMLRRLEELEASVDARRYWVALFE